MKKKIFIFAGIALAFWLTPPPVETFAWTDELMETRCAQFIGNPASESNKVYVATVNGEKSTYLKMKYNPNCSSTRGSHAINNGYNDFTRNKFGTMIVHRPSSDKYPVLYGNVGKTAASFFVKLNTTACAHGKRGYWCSSEFYTDGGHAGNKEYLYAGVSNTGVGVMNSYYPVDNPCTQSGGKNSCFPKGYPWRATAWDSGNISKTNYDSASSGSELYKIKTETVRRFLAQEGMGSDVSYYRNRFSLVNDGEMEAGVLYGSSGGNTYNIVVAAAPATATRNMKVESVTVAGSPNYVKGGSTQTVKVVVRNQGDLGVTANHQVKVSYTSGGQTYSQTGTWYGTIGAGSYKTIDVPIQMPSSTQTITIKGAIDTSYRSYNQWNTDDSLTVSQKVDGETPAMSSVTINRNNVWGNTDVSMYLDVYDTASGIASMQYAMWDDPTGSVVQGWTNFSRYQTLNISREGTTRIQLWAKDHVGNERYSGYYYAKIDKTRPTGSISVNTENWQNTGGVTATLYASDGLSGVRDAQYRLTGATSTGWTKYTNGQQIWISNQGETKIEIWVQDHAGNENYAATKYVRIDRTNPTNSVTLSRDNTWGNTDITATFYTGDTGGSGLKSSQYAMWENSNNAVVTNWTNYSNGQQTTISREGVTKVQTWSQDWANNAVYGTIKYAKIDKTRPTGSISINTENWQNTNSVTATLYAGDALSGVRQAQYRLTGATSTGWTNYSNGQSITITNQGETKIEIWVQDHAGNEIYADTKYVRIDRTDPTGSINFNHENWQNASSVSVTLNAGDAVSGVQSAQYRLSGATSKDWTNFTNGTSFSITNQGETKIEIKVTDYANRSITRTKTVRIDRTAPTLTTSQNPASWTNQNVTITANANDNLALWGVTGYKGSIGVPNLLSATFPKNNGRVLIVVSENTPTNATFSKLLDAFKAKLTQVGMGHTVLLDSQFTSASQATGYQAVFHLAWVWNNDSRAWLLNQVYDNNIPVFSSGNDCAANTSLISSCSTSRNGIYTFNKNSNNYLGELTHGGSRTDDYYLAIPAWSTTKILANIVHSNGQAPTAGILHHTNANSTQWIHHQGADESLSAEFLTSVALLLAQRNTTLTTNLTHTFTVTENGSYPITAYDLAGNRVAYTHVVNTIDRHNPVGSVVIDKGQDFLNDEETTLHLTFNDLVSGNNVASGVKSLRIFDVNGNYSHTINNPSGTSLSIPWVLTPWEAPDGALKAQVGVEITDRAGNRITVYSQVVDIIKVYVTDFYLTDVLNPTVYNKNNPFKRLTYPNIPAQKLLAGGNFSFEFNYYHPKNVDSRWKIDYFLNVRYKKPNGTEEVLKSQQLKQTVAGKFKTQHIIPYTMPKGTQVYLDLQLVLYDQNGRKVAEGYFPQPQNTSLLIGTIQEDIRKILQFNEFS